VSLGGYEPRLCQNPKTIPTPSNQISTPLDQGVFDESIPEHIGYPKIIRFIGISTDKLFFFVPSVFSIYFFNLILSHYIDLGMDVNDMFLYLRVGPFSVERISQ
jgi:hypothetical protein